MRPYLNWSSCHWQKFHVFKKPLFHYEGCPCIISCFIQELPVSEPLSRVACKSVSHFQEQPVSVSHFHTAVKQLFYRLVAVHTWYSVINIAPQCLAVSFSSYSNWSSASHATEHGKPDSERRRECLYQLYILQSINRRCTVVETLPSQWLLDRWKWLLLHQSCWCEWEAKN